jgi:hypothetical protein
VLCEGAAAHQSDTFPHPPNRAQRNCACQHLAANTCDEPLQAKHHPLLAAGWCDREHPPGRSCVSLASSREVTDGAAQLSVVTRELGPIIGYPREGVELGGWTAALQEA